MSCQSQTHLTSFNYPDRVNLGAAASGFNGLIIRLRCSFRRERSGVKARSVGGGWDLVIVPVSEVARPGGGGACLCRRAITSGPVD